MSVFVLPQSTVKEVEKLFRGFLWGISGNRSKLHLASWQQVVNAHLLTRDNLIRFNLQMNSLLCHVCDGYIESHNHLFFECCLSKMILNLIFSWIGFKAWPSDFNGWVVWLANGQHGTTSSILNLVVAAVIYSIWRNRNRCVFYGYSLTVDSIAKEVINIVKYHLYIVNTRKISLQDQLFIRKLQCN
ncbi:uncharacterized protein LOC133799639 [Humulus lupulus]|uniref:uncharacterized protein LOC133799639 n=1 Tax=Humulus lupulus TaxID=3486 RepID=UPI002B405FBC|nr:uncharacterized protein LOC133799639 [Humulus lupulus]